MSQETLRSHGTGPTTEKGEQMQCAFCGSPLSPYGSGLVERVGKEGEDTCRQVDHQHGKRKPAAKNRSTDEEQKADGEQGREAAAFRATRWCGTLADERDSLCSQAPPVIDREFVGNQFVSLWSPLSVRERADVYEDRLSTVVGSNKPESPFIFPSGNSTLAAHVDSMTGLASNSTADTLPESWPSGHIGWHKTLQRSIDCIPRKLALCK